MTFDDVHSEPDQEFELHKDSQGVLEYSTRYVTYVTFNVIQYGIVESVIDEVLKSKLKDFWLSKNQCKLVILDKLKDSLLFILFISSKGITS